MQHIWCVHSGSLVLKILCVQVCCVVCCVVCVVCVLCVCVCVVYAPGSGVMSPRWQPSCNLKTWTSRVYTYGMFYWHATRPCIFQADMHVMRSVTPWNVVFCVFTQFTTEKSKKKLYSHQKTVWTVKRRFKESMRQCELNWQWTRDISH